MSDRPFDTEADRKPFEVWRSTWRGGWEFAARFRRRRLARLYAWEHTKRGWFTYEVREAR